MMPVIRWLTEIFVTDRASRSVQCIAMGVDDGVTSIDPVFITLAGRIVFLKIAVPVHEVENIDQVFCQGLQVVTGEHADGLRQKVERERRSVPCGVMEFHGYALPSREGAVECAISSRLRLASITSANSCPSWLSVGITFSMCAI